MPVECEIVSEAKKHWNGLSIGTVRFRIASFLNESAWK